MVTVCLGAHKTRSLQTLAKIHSLDQTVASLARLTSPFHQRRQLLVRTFQQHWRQFRRMEETFPRWNPTSYQTVLRSRLTSATRWQAAVVRLARNISSTSRVSLQTPLILRRSLIFICCQSKHQNYSLLLRPYVLNYHTIPKTGIFSSDFRSQC